MAMTAQSKQLTKDDFVKLGKLVNLLDMPEKRQLLELLYSDLSKTWFIEDIMNKLADDQKHNRGCIEHCYFVLREEGLIKDKIEHLKLEKGYEERLVNILAPKWVRPYENYELLCKNPGKLYSAWISQITARTMRSTGELKEE